MPNKITIRGVRVHNLKKYRCRDSARRALLYYRCFGLWQVVIGR